MDQDDILWYFTDEQKKLLRDVTQFADDNLEETEIYNAKKEVPWPIFRKIAEKGYFGAAIPKEYGGLELGVTGSAIVAEQMGRLIYVGSAFVGTLIGGLSQILKFGNEEQKKKWLPIIAEGKKLGAVCISEPFAGSDAANVMTTAVKDGNDWVLNGRKRFISGGDIASRYFVYAKTSEDPDVRKNYGHISSFVLEKGTPGFTLERVNSIMGGENSANVYLSFNDVRIPDENRIGAIGKGWNIMMAGLNFERVMNNVAILGGIKDSIKILFHYTKRRVQFNKTTSQVPRIQDLIAEIISQYRMLRVFNYNCAKQIDLGQEPTIDVSIGKWIGGEFLRDIGLKAVQVMGGDGIMDYYPINRLIVLGKTNEIAAGTTETQKMIIYRFSSLKYNKPSRMRWNDEINKSILSNRDSQFKGLEVNEDNVLKVMAHDYKVNPALYMTPEDIKEDLGAKLSSIKEVIGSLEQKKLIVSHKDRRGNVVLVKATYIGLQKAFPEEYYQWFPSWYKDENKF
ncbi:MAG: acyl-CoA dehydrogenase family protein [Promethearchaeota archaeon]